MASFVSPLSSFNAVHARTTPAKEFSSVIAMAESPNSAARMTYSSGCDTPVRNVKLLVIDSSAYPTLSVSISIE
ncbi:hypothetical protein GCM10008927_26010 [Amylibacter ulvae]|uniref:Uncharacterized protein n=1 Tax=Paramylibacter ulvae TaxID=1651968 RepID=A0ABQ3D6G7_9RHOB|nr:hypothetical protein GCM10008927_26010 [Amylibacter ulvae]